MLKLILALIAVSLTSALAQQVGTVAPSFSLPDSSGKSVALESFRGKTVVLEWTNEGCPFVVKHYGSGNMQKLQKEALAKEVVWLAICSSASGKQGHIPPADAAAAITRTGFAGTAYLLDENGQVGKLYGAKRTPELFIIDATGKIVYHGAIDNKKSTAPADIPISQNHIATALSELTTGKQISTPQTEPYGCSIKY